jgi:DNA-binding CsgD family transcriptional regulator/MFS family permease
LWILFLSGPLLGKIKVKSDDQFAQIFLFFIFFNALSYLACSQYMHHWLAGRTRTYFLLSCALITSGVTLAMGLWASGFPSVLLFTLSALAGLGYAPLVCALGEAYSQIPFNKAGLFYGLSILCGTLALFLATYLPVKLAFLITSILPLIALYCLQTMPALADPALTTASVKTIENRSPFDFRLVILIILFYLVGGLMFNMVILFPDAPYQHMFWLSNFIYGAVVLVGAVGIYRNPSFHLRMIYQSALPLLGVGFLLIPFMHGSLIVPFILLQMGFALFDIFIWMLFTSMASNDAIPTRVFGLGFFIITGSIFLGSYLFKWLSLILSLEIDIAGIALMGALIMFAATFWFNRFHDIQWDKDASVSNLIALEDESDAKAESDQLINTGPYHPNGKKSYKKVPDKINPADYASQQIVAEYHFTKRESEVFELLIKGYNNPNVCVFLIISPNTLKTHLRNIYRKADVSNRQELIHLYHSHKVKPGEDGDGMIENS